MGLEDEFNDAVKEVQNLATTPSNDDLLELYGLYKQATVGDNTTVRPGMLDFKGKSKWDAWDKRKGTSSDEAKKLYVQKYQELATKYGKK